MSHPMHLHGHSFWVLAEGNGEWDGTITNPNNPIRRDTIQIGAPNSVGDGYTVIEFMADNPGVWPFHCHFGDHASAGLYVNVLVCRSVF
jgi:FtsP/CotA-like multicopper oxidase with cupredoxin domain